MIIYLLIILKLITIIRKKIGIIIYLLLTYSIYLFFRKKIILVLLHYCVLCGKIISELLNI